MVKRSKLDQPWHEQIVLDDGRVLHVRPIHPRDAEPLRAGFNLLSPEEVRQRFLHTVKELTAASAHRLTHIDPRREFAIVAAEPLPPGEAVVGAVARAAIDADGRHADFGIVVSRPLAGQGLGTLLLKRVIQWCRLKRLDSIYGDVFEDNLNMLGVARRLGFVREPHPDGYGITRIRLPLKPVAVRQPAATGRTA
ncbi:GNAT family N-acetyltransferase [Alkalisalibacterium limincola]|uniref:GNAT family N-acetyltransferase n=1 Tax=Alkalisalibacterium limincola TaxID=2699169 RepID=A0A5C8KPK9_9GAMM|nr:GNAT family N-acetyltransferase [Alkalisalibacterium limincola]